MRTTVPTLFGCGRSSALRLGLMVWEKTTVITAVPGPFLARAVSPDSLPPTITTPSTKTRSQEIWRVTVVSPQAPPRRPGADSQRWRAARPRHGRASYRGSRPLPAYRNAVGAQFGNVEPEVGDWIGVQTSQGFLELSPHTMSVPTLPVNPGAGIEDQALIEIAPALAPRLFQSLVAVPEATRSVKL